MIELLRNFDGFLRKTGGLQHNCPAKSSWFAVPSWSACGTECSGAGGKHSHCFFDGNVHDSPFMVCDEISGPGGQSIRTAFLAILNFREKSPFDKEFLASGLRFQISRIAIGLE